DIEVTLDVSGLTFKVDFHLQIFQYITKTYDILITRVFGESMIDESEHIHTVTVILRTELHVVPHGNVSTDKWRESFHITYLRERIRIKFIPESIKSRRIRIVLKVIIINARLDPGSGVSRTVAVKNIEFRELAVHQRDIFKP